MEFFEQYVSEILTLVVGAFLGWFPNRKRQKVDTKMIEVEVLERALKVMQDDVIEPLRSELILLREENKQISNQLKRLHNAFQKMYTCRNLPDCPIHFELQKPTANNGAKGNRKQPTNRQREPVDRENDATDNDSDVNGPDDDIPGQS